MSQTREVIQDGIADAKTEKSIVKPYVMSHGTMEVLQPEGVAPVLRGVPRPRVRAPRQARDGGALRAQVPHHRGGSRRRGAPGNLLNHWGIDVGSKEEVDAAHANALKYKDKYRIRQVLPVVMQHGVYSFYLEDLDHNWWEIQYYPGLQNEDLFDFGDRFSMDDGAEVGELKELNVKTSA